MVLWGIFVSAFLIGFSGAMMPGPLLGVTIDGSLKGMDSGTIDVLGHGILEFLLIIIMLFGLRTSLPIRQLRGLSDCVAVLFWRGWDMG